jgi:hypothetical protein
MELQLYFKSWHNFCKIQKALCPDMPTHTVDGSRLNWTALPADPFLQLNISFNEFLNLKVSSFKQKHMKLKENFQYVLRPCKKLKFPHCNHTTLESYIIL